MEGTTPKKPEEKRPEIEIKTFSTGFIQERIRALLETHKNIKEIKNLNVGGKGNEITLDVTVVAKKGLLTPTVGVKAVLANRSGGIKVKSHLIDAGRAVKGTVEGMIMPKLEEISEILKSNIEIGENKKVKKIEIANGELKVTFIVPTINTKTEFTTHIITEQSPLDSIAVGSIISYLGTNYRITELPTEENGNNYSFALSSSSETGDNPESVGADMLKKSIEGGDAKLLPPEITENTDAWTDQKQRELEHEIRQIVEPATTGGRVTAERKIDDLVEDVRPGVAVSNLPDLKPRETHWLDDIELSVNPYPDSLSAPKLDIPISEPEDGKTTTLELRETIANAQRTIEENERKIEVKLKRLAEIRGGAPKTMGPLKPGEFIAIDPTAVNETELQRLTRELDISKKKLGKKEKGIGKIFSVGKERLREKIFDLEERIKHEERQASVKKQFDDQKKKKEE